MKGDPRIEEFGTPKADNANYLWIHFFYSALNETSRAGFVMANSASDARGSELEIRKKLIQAGGLSMHDTPIDRSIALIVSLRLHTLSF